ASPTPTPDSARVEVARALVAILDPGAGMLQTFETALPAQKAANPRIPAMFWEEIEKRAKSDLPKLIEIMVPIYAAHFSTDELHQLMQFFQSPLGQRLRAEQPAIMNESMQAGQKWGMEVAADVLKEMAAKGVFPQ